MLTTTEEEDEEGYGQKKDGIPILTNRIWLGLGQSFNQKGTFVIISRSVGGSDLLTDNNLQYHPLDLVVWARDKGRRIKRPLR